MQCRFEGCERGATRLGLCVPHYKQQWRGQPLRPLRKPMTFVEAFWEKVDKSGTCWLWTGGIAGNYGSAWNGRRIYAHRLSWEMANGRPVPASLLVMHSCDTPLCVRPDHLSVGTHADNATDMVAKGRAPVGDKSGARRHPEKRPQGERHGGAILSLAQVSQVRADASRGGITKRDIARRLGVSDSTIGHIINGHSWRPAQPPLLKQQSTNEVVHG